MFGITRDSFASYIAATNIAANTGRTSASVYMKHGNCTFAENARVMSKTDLGYFGPRTLRNLAWSGEVMKF